MGGRRGRSAKVVEDAKVQSSVSSKSEQRTRSSRQDKKDEAPLPRTTKSGPEEPNSQSKPTTSRLSRNRLRTTCNPKPETAPLPNKGKVSARSTSSPKKSTSSEEFSPSPKVRSSGESSTPTPNKQSKQDSRLKLKSDSPSHNKHNNTPKRQTSNDIQKQKSEKNKKSKSNTVAMQPPELNKDINNLDISSILALGENMTQNGKSALQTVGKEEISDDSDFENSSSSDSDNEWEEVSQENQNEMSSLEKSLEEKPYTMPEGGVQITIAKDGVQRKKGKKGFDIQGYIRREMNRNTKELYVDLHKVSLLCLLARGIMINNYLRLEDHLAAGYSLLPTKQSCPPKYVDVGYLERFINWFRSAIKVNRYVLDSFGKYSPNRLKSQFECELIFQLQRKEAKDVDNLVFMFILILRSCGIMVRLVWSLQPIALKPDSDKLLKKPPEPKSDEDPDDEKTQQKKKKDEKTPGDDEWEPEPSCSKSTTSKKSSKDVVAKNKGASKNKGKLNGKQVESKSAKKSPDGKPKGRKMISSSDDEEVSNMGNNMWPEVYLEEEERWVSVDLVDGKFMCDAALEAKATKKICYIIGINNNGLIKDVTRRYDTHWLTGTQKLRESDWWNETLKPYRGKRTAIDKMEDNFLDEHILAQAFPKSIQEFKGHPLYTLRRHLLKFEAIYPPDPPSLGFIKNEPVYARECVKTLHSRELWLKQAKVVRMGEIAYKIVKSRPKYDKFSGHQLPSQPLDLFGEWQVEDFVPPTAENGKVPRNEYGNVELFLDKMLPKGTVHLQLPGLNRTARKLDIDCAPALTGFDFHCGGSHPTYDGFVVCEEFKDILMDAWHEEQKEQEKREKEKREKRIYANWAKLLKGLLIREKLNRKYAFNLGGKRKNEETECETGPPKAGPSKKHKK